MEFDVGIGLRECCGPPANIASMYVLGRVTEVGYVCADHVTLTASVADIVDAVGSHH